MKTILVAFLLLLFSVLPVDAASDISSFAGRYRITSKAEAAGIRVKTAPNKEWGGFYLNLYNGDWHHFSFRGSVFRFTYLNAHAYIVDTATGVVSISPDRIVFRSLESPDGITVSGRIVRTTKGFRLIYTLDGVRRTHAFIKVGATNSN
jgi:hypothetical protein